MTILDFPLFDTEVLYRNVAKRNGPLFFFQRPIGMWDDAHHNTKTTEDTNLSMAGCLPQAIEFRAWGCFFSYEGLTVDLEKLEATVVQRAELVLHTGWLQKHPVIAMRQIPIHPMSVLQPLPNGNGLQLWKLVNPKLKTYPFAMTIENAACITAALSWGADCPDPGFEAPVRLRLVVVGKLEAPDCYWRNDK